MSPMLSIYEPSFDVVFVFLAIQPSAISVRPKKPYKTKKRGERGSGYNRKGESISLNMDKRFAILVLREKMGHKCDPNSG